MGGRNAAKGRANDHDLMGCHFDNDGPVREERFVVRSGCTGFGFEVQQQLSLGVLNCRRRLEVVIKSA